MYASVCMCVCGHVHVPHSLPACVYIRRAGTCVGSIDVTDADALKQLFRDHADENTTVWNMAAPLSV